MTRAELSGTFLSGISSRSSRTISGTSSVFERFLVLGCLVRKMLFIKVKVQSFKCLILKAPTRQVQQVHLYLEGIPYQVSEWMARPDSHSCLLHRKVGAVALGAVTPFLARGHLVETPVSNTTYD